jgi:hypothetical protein
MMSGSIRFPFWELNRRPKTGFEVVDEKPQVSVFTATRHPSSGAGKSGKKIVSLVGLAGNGCVRWLRHLLSMSYEELWL